ncbi:MAG TPA: hypothetical protein VF069_01130 [Streptosporangiaceae bacterium]
MRIEHSGILTANGLAFALPADTAGSVPTSSTQRIAQWHKFADQWPPIHKEGGHRPPSLSHVDVLRFSAAVI